MRFAILIVFSLLCSLKSFPQCIMIVKGTSMNLEKDSLNYYFSLAVGEYLEERYPYSILKKKLNNDLIELQWIKKSDSSIFQTCQFSTKNHLANGKGAVSLLSDSYKINWFLNYLDGKLHGVAKFNCIDTVDGDKTTEIIHYWHGIKNGRRCLLDNDAILELCTYENDKLEGAFELYNSGYNGIGDSDEMVIESNNLFTVLQYKNGIVIDGEYKFYDHLGNCIGKRIYKNGKFSVVKFD